MGRKSSAARVGASRSRWCGATGRRGELKIRKSEGSIPSTSTIKDKPENAGLNPVPVTNSHIQVLAGSSNGGHPVAFRPSSTTGRCSGFKTHTVRVRISLGARRGRYGFESRPELRLRSSNGRIAPFFTHLSFNGRTVGRLPADGGSIPSGCTS